MKTLRGLIILAPIILSGCATFGSGLMPSSVQTSTSPWESYEKAREIFDKITPYTTTLQDLRKLSFDPVTAPNTRFIDSLAVRNMFLGNPTARVEDLPEGMQDCLKDFEKCKGYEFRYRKIHEKGVGNFLSRATKFVVENLKTGSDVVFKIFLKDELVVFKLDPEGTPNIHEHTVKKNPLGPLQEPIDVGIRYAPVPTW